MSIRASGRAQRGTLTDPGVRAALILLAVALAGFVGLGLGWAGLASKLFVALQLPFFISGVVGGVALAGAGLGLLAIHLERRAGATERLMLDDAVRDVAEFAELLRAEARRAQ